MFPDPEGNPSWAFLLGHTLLTDTGTRGGRVLGAGMLSTPGRSTGFHLRLAAEQTLN